MAQSDKALEDLCINTIRVLSIEAVQKANSGHPGLPLGAAAMAYVLWTRFLRHNPKNPQWVDRDRFVLSAGHGSALLYSLLHLTGYELSLDELKRFRQWGSKTPGHPERGETAGVEITTGPLGQGFANGVGMAIAERWLASQFNRASHEIVDHYTYGICGDGDLMEGVAAEAASLAGHLGLGKLIYLYDDNHISLAGSTALSFTEDVGARFEAYGWHVEHVDDGNDTSAVAEAIETARSQESKPSLIIVRTHIGFGSPKKQDTFGAHGSPLGPEEVEATKKNLGWTETEPFALPSRAVDSLRGAIAKGDTTEKAWQTKFEAYRKAYPTEATAYERAMRGELPEGWRSSMPAFKPEDKPVSTRVAGGKALSAFANKIPNIIGGSADLNPSTETALKGMGDFQPTSIKSEGVQGTAGGVWGYSGRNVHFGVREHAMGSAVNGMAAHGGVVPYSATFFAFLDYMKPAVRLGSLMGLHAVYVFTHDSIALGEDGPTHEPIEQLASLRATPGLVTIRPADANEAAEAWAVAIERNKGPTALVMTRQNVPVLDRSGAKEAGVARGGYVLADGTGAHEVVLIATGSEVFALRRSPQTTRVEVRRQRAGSQPTEFRTLRRAAAGLSRFGVAPRVAQARQRRSRFDLRVGALRFVGGHHDRNRSLRRISAGRRKHEALRLYDRPRDRGGATPARAQRRSGERRTRSGCFG